MPRCLISAIVAGFVLVCGQQSAAMAQVPDIDDIPTPPSDCPSNPGCNNGDGDHNETYHPRPESMHDRSLDAFNEGIGAWNHKDWLEAESYFRKALDLDPGNSRAETMLARLALWYKVNSEIQKGDDAADLGDFQTADTYYRNALQLSQNSFNVSKLRAALARVDAHLQLRQDTAAIQSIARTLSDTVSSQAPAAAPTVAGLDFTSTSSAPVMVLSPSENLEPWTRAAFERQLANLSARRERAELELRKINNSTAGESSPASENAQIIRELSEDSISDSLDVLGGVLSEFGDELPPSVLNQLESTLSVAKTSTAAAAAVGSKPGSERQHELTFKALTSLAGALPTTPPRGIDVITWDALRYAVSEMPHLMDEISRPKSTSTGRSDLERWAASVDKMVEAAGRLPVIGPPVTGVRSAGQLVDSQIALLQLRHDREELQLAGVTNQTARRYWMERVANLKTQEATYRASLGQGSMP